MLFFGWLLLIAAGVEVVQAFMVGKWAGLFNIGYMQFCSEFSER